MHFLISQIALVGLVALCSASPVASPSVTASASPQQIVQQAQTNYKKNMASVVRSQASRSGCNPSKLLIRKAWDDMSRTERLDYTQAAQCMYTQPSRTDPAACPGARTRVDDFVYQHINQTNFMHQDGMFLPWHRQYIWSWEKDLREVCGYKGALPYWAWERYANLSASPVFGSGQDGFGGDGAYEAYDSVVVSPVGLPAGTNLTQLSFTRPTGNGGGCIHDGAFANITLNIGPVTPAQPINTPDNIYGYKYNPRCLKRDLYPEPLDWSVVANLMQTDSIHTFHPLLEFTAHFQSHLHLGKDGMDTYSTPNDPIFWLLHGQIDRLWSLWQGQDYANRRDGLDGTVTTGNVPPSANATLDTIMQMGVPAGGDLPIHVAVSTVENEYCYVYA